MGAIKKVTVHLPDDLVRAAQRSSGKGLTETIREGLQLVAARKAYTTLRRFRGKVQLGLDLDELRRDR